MKKQKIIIVSGYFNPLHKGHLELLIKQNLMVICFGLLLIVIYKGEGSSYFMDQDERLIIIESIGIVDKALISLDFDKTQRLTLTNLSKQYGTKYDLYSPTVVTKITKIYRN